MTRKTKYALLGSGRLATHLQHYLQILGTNYVQWSRRDGTSLPEKVADATHILLAVKDSAIADLAAEVAGEGRVLVHFSGALNVPGVSAAHPLMTFGTELGPRDWYFKIPFVIDRGEEMSNLLPGFPNPHEELDPSYRALYHALCSLAGNASFLMWKRVGDAFEKNLGLKRDLLEPFLHQVVVNALHSPTTGFTGPVARGDWSTVESHLNSLNPSPELREAYKGYLGLAKSSGLTVPEALL